LRATAFDCTSMFVFVKSCDHIHLINASAFHSHTQWLFRTFSHLFLLSTWFCTIDLSPSEVHIVVVFSVCSQCSILCHDWNYGYSNFKLFSREGSVWVCSIH